MPPRYALQQNSAAKRFDDGGGPPQQTELADCRPPRQRRPPRRRLAPVTCACIDKLNTHCVTRTYTSTSTGKCGASGDFRTPQQRCLDIEVGVHLPTARGEKQNSHPTPTVRELNSSDTHTHTLTESDTSQTRTQARLARTMSKQTMQEQCQIETAAKNDAESKQTMQEQCRIETTQEQCRSTTNDRA